VHQTIAVIEEMNIDYVIPLHCSGEMFYELAKSEMPTRLLRSYTGTRFAFEVAVPEGPGKKRHFLRASAQAVGLEQGESDEASTI